MPAALTVDHLRRYAITRSLFKPTTLLRAIKKLGFVQVDPIRAPARAQDLTLRHRVSDYRAGDLEARYPRLAVEEDFFVNYGVLPRTTQRLMHPRTARAEWPRSRWMQAQAVLEFVQSRGVVHPREVDAAFEHGTTRNWFGGNSRASTQLLDGMHYRGLLRVARREAGIRLYAPQPAPAPDRGPTDPDATLDTLIDVAIAKYAPLPAATLSRLVTGVGSSAVPQWRERRRAALARAVRAAARGRSRLRVTTAAQLNGRPHLGTVTTIMLVFALTARMADELDLPATIVFDSLENGVSWSAPISSATASTRRLKYWA
jgi:uncharacterized protein YcaQ